MISEEGIKKLEKVLANYPNIFSEFGIKEQIFKLYKFEKFLVSIEIYDEHTRKIVKFIKDLNEFFFIGHIYFNPESQIESKFSGLIFISRFKNIFDVAMNYANTHKGLLDEFADLSGILFGYSPKEVANYCSGERLKKYNLMK